MDKCVVPQMRDLLPDLAAERLTGAALARAAAHVAACPECAAELEMLRVARRALSRGVPSIDVGRIVAALPKPPSENAAGRATTRKKTRRIAAVRGGAPQPASVAYRRITWTTWRIAALATLAVGGLSLAVLRGSFGVGAGAGGARPASVSTTPTTPQPAHTGSPSASPGASTPSPTSPVPAPPNSAATGATSVAPSPDTAEASEGLAVAGDISELSDGDIEALLQGMDTVDASPAADPEESAPAMAAVVPSAVAP